jgi:NAD(P)-dependent dehydrogenase (short-subunit alcohol dehydrogenase family)
MKLDITDDRDIETVVRRMVEQSGGIYGLVNNAGIGLRGFFEDQADEEIRQVFETNVFATMAVTRAVLPHMREKRRGRIVIVTSVGGRMGMLGVSSYCATKFAQEGFGEALAQEVKPLGIRVSLVAPAIIKTERWSINRGIARRAMRSESPYHEWFKKAERLADWAVETSPTKPVEVATVVHHVLTARRPRLRYMVGRRANLMFRLRRYVPGEWFDRFYVGEVIRRVTKPEHSL